MDNEEFIKRCKVVVSMEERVKADQVFIVWYAKELKNHKAVLSSSNDNAHQYEFTFNGETQEIYVDKYKKVKNSTLDVGKRIIFKGRGEGKTTEVIVDSYIHNAPIILNNSDSKRYVKKLSEDLELKIPDPITISELQSYELKGIRNSEKMYLVDNAELVLSQLLSRYGVNRVSRMSITNE